MDNNRGVACKYEPNKSKLFDFFRIVSWGYKIELAEHIKTENAKIGLKQSSIVEQAIKYVWDEPDREAPGLLALLTVMDDGYNFLTYEFERAVHGINDFDTFITRFKESDKGKLVEGLLNFIYNENKERNLYQIIIKEDQKGVIDLINALPLEMAVKWDIIYFIYNTAEIIDELAEIFVKMYQRLEAIYNDNAENFRNIERDIETKLLKLEKGNTPFKEIVELQKQIDLNEYEIITLYFSIIAEFTLQWEEASKKELCICLGLNYARSVDMNMAKVYWREINALLRALSDETRQKIYSMLCEKEMFTAEIGDELGIVPSTMAYHMDLLEKANILDKRYFSKWIYYKVNKDKVDRILNLLQKCMLEGVINRL